MRRAVRPHPGDLPTMPAGALQKAAVATANIQQRTATDGLLDDRELPRLLLIRNRAGFRLRDGGSSIHG